MTAANQQQELFRAEPADPNVRWLENFLLDQHDWATAVQILERISYPATDNNKRWLRQLASASEWILSGQKGYRHIQGASPEEIHHASAWLISQGRAMFRRGIKIRKAGHRIVG